MREGVDEKEDVEGATERARVTGRVRVRVCHTYSGLDEKNGVKGHRRRPMVAL